MKNKGAGALLLVFLLCAGACSAMAQGIFEQIIRLPDGMYLGMAPGELASERVPLEGMDCRRSYVFEETGELREVHVTLDNIEAPGNAEDVYQALLQEMSAAYDWERGTLIVDADRENAAYFSLEIQWLLEKRGDSVTLGFYPPNDNYDEIAAIYADGNIMGHLALGMTREQADQAVRQAGLPWKKDTHPDFPSLALYVGMEFPGFASSALCCFFDGDGRLAMAEMSFVFPDYIALAIAHDELKAIMEKKCGGALDSQADGDRRYTYYADQGLLACVFKDPENSIVSVRYTAMPEQ